MSSRALAHRLRWLPALLAMLAAGCATRKENLALKRSVSELQGRHADLQRRARGLDADNQRLQSLLAQEQQRGQQIQSELAARPVPYGQSPVDNQPSGAGYDYPAASPPNDSPIASSSRSDSGGWLPMSDIPGADVQRDGDVIRIRLTSAQLFDPGRATLKPGANNTLRRVADAIHQNYPGYLVGVEGHTDADPIRKSKWKHNHELSVQRAMAVYDHLLREGGLASSQLFVAGYGPNRPLASNSGAKGKARNRRVELVIYHERLAQR